MRFSGSGHGTRIKWRACVANLVLPTDLQIPTRGKDASSAQTARCRPRRALAWFGGGYPPYPQGLLVQKDTHELGSVLQNTALSRYGENKRPRARADADATDWRRAPSQGKRMHDARGIVSLGLLPSQCTQQPLASRRSSGLRFFGRFPPVASVDVASRPAKIKTPK